MGWNQYWNVCDCLWEGEKDVHEGVGPLRAVDLMEFFEHNLHLLPVGSAHRDKVKTLPYISVHDPFRPNEVGQLTYFSILHLIRRIGFEKVRHLERLG